MALIGMPHIAAASGDNTSEALLMLTLLPFSIGVFVLGTRCWRGKELPAVAEYERTKGRWPWAAQGTLRKYRTMMGASYLHIIVGPGIALVAGADLIRLAAGQGRDWRPWLGATVAGIVLLGIAAVLLYAYLFFGLPDALRPPCQRGWKEVRGRLVLVRPGTTDKEREERRAIEVDPLYRDLIAARKARREARQRDPWSNL